jgi:polyhydroxyalkanoate synthase subunit PhaC
MGQDALVRYEPRGPRRHPVPVLIVSPLLAKPYVLDLAPGLSLVDHLVERGLELFLLDFGIPDSRDRQLRFEDHLGVVDLAMNELLAQTGVKRATLLGYCLGGIFATVYAATHPDSVQNLVALATPVDFSRGGPVYRYVRTLDVDGLVDRLGNVPGEWIRDQVWAFTMMTMPARNLRIWRELLCSWDPGYLERQRLVSRWLNDLVPFPGEAYRQFVKELVQANKLVRGDLLIDGNAADPSQITCPVLVLAHTGDVLAPPESAQALLEVVSSADRQAVTVFGRNARPCGHRGRTRGAGHHVAEADGMARDPLRSGPVGNRQEREAASPRPAAPGAGRRMTAAWRQVLTAPNRWC